jgi:Na+/H+ antiporter NhaD/arsenite permease-like protein
MMFVLDWISARQYAREVNAPAVPLDSSAIIPAIVDPTLLRWTLGITAAVFLGFFLHGVTGMPPAVPAAIGAAAALIVQDVLHLRKHRPTAQERAHGLLDIIESEIEWPTLLFFIFLFVVVGAAVETGLITSMARGLHWSIDAGAATFGLSGRGTLVFAALLILWVSGMLSALIDNIPYVAVAIPIVARLADTLAGDTQVLWWALSLGACLGGNGTPVGASANVTTIGLAEKDGERISFGDFTRFGTTVTAATLVVSSAFVTSHIFLGQRPTLWIGLAIIVAVLIARGGYTLKRNSITSPSLTT